MPRAPIRRNIQSECDRAAPVEVEVAWEAAGPSHKRGALGRYDLLDLRFGTFLPFRRASESPMAIACLRLLTFLPLFPLLSVPFLRFFIAPLTVFDAPFEYLRAIEAHSEFRTHVSQRPAHCGVPFVRKLREPGGNASRFSAGGRRPMCCETNVMQKRRVRPRGLPSSLFRKRLRAAPNSLIEEDEALDLLGTVDDRQDVGEAAASTLGLG